MSNVFKFDPNAIRERKRLNGDAAAASAADLKARQEKKESRRAWIGFAALAVLLTVLKAAFHF
jgi:hypothetical protein